MVADGLLGRRSKNMLSVFKRAATNRRLIQTIEGAGEEFIVHFQQF